MEAIRIAFVLPFAIVVVSCQYAAHFGPLFWRGVKNWCHDVGQWCQGIPKPGAKLLWLVGGTDIPVVVTGYLGKFGKEHYVSVQNSKAGVPVGQLRRPL